jgi:hypothetical protein
LLLWLLDRLFFENLTPLLDGLAVMYAPIASLPLSIEEVEAPCLIVGGESSLKITQHLSLANGRKGIFERLLNAIVASNYEGLWSIIHFFR